jgi:hypothetical protein
MKMPSVMAEELIEDAGFGWIDHVYRGSVPEEVSSNTESTDVAISEWLSEPAGFANRTFKRWQIGVEVSIFYKLKPTVTLIDAEIQLAKLFMAAGWTIEQSKSHIKDPASLQQTKVFYFVKLINLKEAE